MSRALVLVTNGSEEIETITICDVLRRGGVHLTLASIHDGLVKCANGTQLNPDMALKELPLTQNFDLLALPGGTAGAMEFSENEEVQHLIKQFYSNGKLVAAICAAPIALHTAGLLEGKKFTCYPALKDKISRSNFCNERVVQDGQIVTS